MTADVGSMKIKKGVPMCEQLYAHGVWNGFTLTHIGSLMGGLEMSGVDPTGLGEHDRKIFSSVLRGLYQGLDQSLVVSQYYWHFEGKRVRFGEVDDPRSRLLSQRRQDYLNNVRGLNASRLFWLVEAPAEENINKLLSVSLLKHLFQAPVEVESRQLLLAKFSNRRAWLAEEAELERQHDVLDAALGDLASRAEILSPTNTRMSLQQMWALQRALVNLDPTLLETALNEEVPVEDWDLKLADGSIAPVQVDGMDCLKFRGPVPRYARIATITGFGSKYVTEGIWVHAAQPPVLQKGNYVIMNRFSPLSKIKKGLMLRNKENELARQNMKLSALFKGGDPNSAMADRLEQSVYLKQKLRELEDADNSDDRWGYYNSHIIMWDEDPKALKQAVKEMNTRLAECSLSVVWESAGQIQLFPSLLPGYGKRCTRSFEFNTSQAGAAALAYKSHPGVSSNPVTGAPTYVLESRDRVPFDYTEFIADKGLVIGTGPTRGGKTFFKNCVASHFMRFGGIYRDIGVDDGAEPLAAFFGDDAGLFRITDPASSKGFAAFAAADRELGDGDGLFVNHLLGNLRVMLELNDAAALRELEAHEQKVLDDAIRAVLRMPSPRMRTLRQLHTHLDGDLKLKFDRWVKGGSLANMFDNVEDDLGALDKRVGIYNLSGLKDIPKLAALAQREIFYRTSKAFENPAIRDVVKQLGIDECQYFLQTPGATEFLLAKVRTWNKFTAGLNLWTQSPYHYSSLPDWGMLRSAATTFVFAAEPKMDRDLRNAYRETYGLSEGQVDAISSLIPRKEMFIWQREADVSKIVCLNAEKEQYAIATSRPSEAAVVHSLLKQYPGAPDQAIDEAVKRLGLKDQ